VAAVDAESLQPAVVAGVQHVDEVVGDGDARREVAARRVDVREVEAVSADAEDGNRIAPRVHGEEQAVTVVVDERALGREPVRLGSRSSRPASAAGRIRASLIERAVVAAAEDDHTVAGELVHLYEHELVDAASVTALPVVAVRRLGGSEGRDEEYDERYEGACALHVCPPLVGGSPS
jgi:hypothetical protein